MCDIMMRKKNIAEKEDVDKGMDGQRKTTFQKECDVYWELVRERALRIMAEIQYLKEEPDA